MQKLKKNIDDRGKLVPLNFSDLPFVPKRIFYIDNVPENTTRGGHAHYRNRQILICITGKINVGLDYGKNYEELILEPDYYCLVENMVWDTQTFLEKDSRLLVLCSEEFNVEDYIKNKETFYSLVNKNV